MTPIQPTTYDSIPRERYILIVADGFYDFLTDEDNQPARSNQEALFQYLYNDAHHYLQSEQDFHDLVRIIHERGLPMDPFPTFDTYTHALHRLCLEHIESLPCIEEKESWEEEFDHLLKIYEQYVDQFSKSKYVNAKKFNKAFQDLENFAQNHPIFLNQLPPKIDIHHHFIFS